MYRTDTVTPPPARPDGPIRITASAARPPAVLWWIRDRLDIEMVGIGSAGAKAMAVVRGDVDAYIHAGGQWEWDSAAPAAVRARPKAAKDRMKARMAKFPQGVQLTFTLGHYILERANTSTPPFPRSLPCRSTAP